MSRHGYAVEGVVLEFQAVHILQSLNRLSCQAIRPNRKGAYGMAGSALPRINSRLAFAEPSRWLSAEINGSSHHNEGLVTV